MATTRKSDFTGETFGSWRVTERADAMEGRRRWSVINDVTGEERTVYQTELKGLTRIPDVTVDAEGVRRNDIGQRVHGDDDPIVVGRVYEPAGEFCEAAMICAEVLDWTRGLPVETPDEHLVDESDVLSSIDHRDGQLGGVGAQAEAGVSEVELDQRAAAVPQDPMKKAIRDVFDTTVDLRNDMLAIAGEAEAFCNQVNLRIAGLQMDYNNLMEKLDQALKVAITR